MNKVSDGAGMIEQKNYLIRHYMDFFQIRHARLLLDIIEKRSTVASKQNIFVQNFNVVKTGCLLIEMLELLS